MPDSKLLKNGAQLLNIPVTPGQFAKADPAPKSIPRPKPAPLVRHIGRFRVPQHMLDDHITARAIYRDMIVMRAEANFVDNTLMVWADHPDFDVLVPGTLVPEYVATITAPKGLAPRRHQDLRVRWAHGDVGDTHRFKGGPDKATPKGFGPPTNDPRESTDG
jgi:hypothetical protein